MIISHHKEKAYNAITYFLEHTGTCYKKKTFKLLWLLDSEHFRLTGRSVTGYDYFAWKMGPVPTELDEAIDSDDPELLERFEIIRESQGKYSKIELRSKHSFETKYFSKKEMALLSDLADRFDLATADEMEEYTHRPGTPWYRVWVEEKRQQGQIPFEYALASLSENDREIILAIAEERRAFLTNYQ